MPILAPADRADAIVAETIFRLKRKRAQATSHGAQYDPELAETPEAYQAALQRMREPGGLAAYASYVFGYEPAAHHQLIIDILEKVSDNNLFHPETGRKVRKVLLLAPPNTAKSTYVSQIFPPWYTCRHPSDPILFFTSSDPNAGLFDTAYALAFEESERHAQVFPNEAQRPSKKKGWSGDKRFLKGMRLGSKDPNFKAVGFGTKVIGARAHGIILDDPLDQKNSESKIEQSEAARYFTMTVEPRMPITDGWLIAIMTRWHEGDLGGYLKSLAKEDDEWLVVELPMLAYEPHPNRAPDPLGRAPDEPLWPERFSLEWCKRRRENLGTAQWNCVYMLDPTALGGDVFTDESWLRPIPASHWFPTKDTPAPFDRLPTVQAWDFGFSDSGDASFTVGLTGQVDSVHHLYVVGHYRRQVSPWTLVGDLVSEILFWKPALLAVEESAFRKKVVVDVLREVVKRLKARGYYYTKFKIVKPTQDKIIRARLPAGRAQGGFLHLDHDAPWFEGMKTELLGFPKTLYTDQVDGLSLLAEMVWENPLQSDQRPQHRLVMDPHGERRLKQPLILTV